MQLIPREPDVKHASHASGVHTTVWHGMSQTRRMYEQVWEQGSVQAACAFGILLLLHAANQPTRKRLEIWAFMHVRC